jgi:hypothetical protein
MVEITAMLPREFVARMIELGLGDVRLEDLAARCLLPTGTLPDGSGVFVADDEEHIGEPDEPISMLVVASGHVGYAKWSRVQP